MPAKERLYPSPTVPYWKLGGGPDDSDKMQLNPLSAIARSESQAKIQQIFTAATMLAVLLVVVIGTSSSVLKKQKVNVEASFNLKKSMKATVLSVDDKLNTFAAKYGVSFDPTIENSSVDLWTIQLPPGVTFARSSQESVKTCYEVPDLERSLTEAREMPCKTIIRPNKEVLVEYLIVDTNKALMVARTIIGQEEREE